MPRIELSGDLFSLVHARAFTSATLAALGLPEWPAVLVVSELASNAVRHARSSYTVSVDVDGGSLTLSVWDQGRAGDLEPAGGLGLKIVDTLAQDWGVDDVPGDGKVVWARIPLWDESP